MHCYQQAALPTARAGGKEARFHHFAQVVGFDLPIFIFSDRTAVFDQFQQFHGASPFSLYSR